MRIRQAITCAAAAMPAAAAVLVGLHHQALRGSRGEVMPWLVLGTLGAALLAATTLWVSRPPRRLRRVDALRALHEVALAASSGLGLDEALDTVLRHSSRLAGVDGCAITLIDENGRLRVRRASGLGEAILAALEDPIGAPVRASAAKPGQRAARPGRSLEAAAYAPMAVSGSEIGGLHIYASGGRRLAGDELQFVAALAAQAATAVQNARLQEEARHTTRDVRGSFRRIGAALASGLDLDDTLALIAELACEMLRADACLIRILEPTTAKWASRAAYGLAVDEVEALDLGGSEGLSGRVAHTGSPVVIADLLDAPYPVAASAAGAIRAYLGVPLRVKSQVFGVLAVFKRAPYPFSREETELLSSFGAQASIAIENRRLWEQESRTAQTLRRSLLPQVPPALDGLELGHLYEPSQRDVDVGGDFYDLIPLDFGRVGVVMGDVCGKGIRAAVYTAMAKYAIRSYAFDDPSPADVMRRTNRALCRQIVEESLFVSMAYALVDARSATLSLANAGHPPPLHFRHATGTAAPVFSDGTLAGLIPHARYTETQVALSPGDIILLYTDGISEARRGREVWGVEALARSLERHAAKPASDLVLAAVQDARHFAAGPLQDDVALLAIRLP